MKNRLITTLGCALLLSGCLAQEGMKAGNLGKMGMDVNLYPLNKVVCDPLNEDVPPPTLYGGLKADLYYWTPDAGPRWYSTADYISKGKKSENFFFFSELNVPTRLFSMGFPTETGGMVKDDAGQDLVEFFALRFSTVVKLAASDLEGDYELALLSDDGSVWRVRDENGQYQAVVENDGDTSTRLGCSANVIHMTHETELVVQLDYYQGPRTEIALVPLWRHVDGARQPEPDCGHAGQRIWFDYLDNSKPTQKYMDLLARGWKPLSRENYEQVNSVAFNPCYSGVTPAIENLEVNSDDGRIYATWTTTVPATSQMRILNVDTGEEILTVSDNIVRRSHEVYQFNVRAGHYKVQAVSISETYGKAVSFEIPITVL